MQLKAQQIPKLPIASNIALVAQYFFDNKILIRINLALA